MKKRIEFGELQIGETARKHINECLDTNWISMGPKVELLENQFASLMGCKYGVAVSSGTTALTAMTLAMPEIAKRRVIKGKSKILCPALGFIANSTSVVSGGLIPKWVDIKCDTLNLNEELLEESIDDDVVGIYAIGTMGRPCELDKIKTIADKYDLILFEDACENYGSKFKGQFSHKYAVGGCSSLFTAHLVNSGEGSIIYTDDEKLKDILISIRSHGRPGKSAFFNHVRFGSNFKMTDLCASVGLEGVEQFNENIKERRYIWQELVNHSEQYKKYAWFSEEPEHIEIMPHGFSITLKHNTKKNILELQNLMDKYNIHWKRNFGFCGQHDALKNFIDADLSKYRNAIWCGNNGIHIGCHRYMTAENIMRIKECLDVFFNSL